MNTIFKDFPLCINCKYFMEEKSGAHKVAQNCGLTMVNPVNGDYEARGNRQAASYRKENNPCGPAGTFFKAKDGKKVEPKKKPVVVVEKKESTAKVIKVEVPEMNADFEAGVQVNFGVDDKEPNKLLWDKMTPEAEKKIRDHTAGLAKELLDDAQKEPTEEPKKRRKGRTKRAE